MNQRNPRVLVVDDDLRMRALLEEFLEQNGVSVTALANGKQISQVLSRQKVDLLILDLMLPGEDGLSICRRLRKTGVNVPIIMLTAKGADVDRIVGLELGADDYLAKPFNPRELLARIGAVLRRRHRDAPDSAARDDSVYRFGPYELDVAARSLRKDGKPLSLTTGEFAVLHALVCHAREPLSRERLVELSRRRDYAAHDRSMDVQVSRLRRLIESDTAQPRYIQTVWGFGYVFVPEGSGG